MVDKPVILGVLLMVDKPVILGVTLGDVDVVSVLEPEDVTDGELLAGGVGVGVADGHLLPPISRI
jgi:hypothetical protein